MTINESKVILWDDGGNRLWLFSVPDEDQYRYIEDKPCITFGIAYENAFFKGQDVVTLFDHYLSETVSELEKVCESRDGSFRLSDVGGDSDCFIDFKKLSLGALSVSGRLGATFSSHSLTFEFVADQTLLEPLIKSLRIS